ncbi:diaminopimelate epimerase [Acetonema longum]|uniref:Diaminopimelate epimerase n=1 Tax=Acetonema longum DSM 6540 TaxID=1009370 RepID=F7NLD3_9FIRM|nr:diaminopimelate epimerase [Acetonema longum DSM 6540]
MQFSKWHGIGNDFIIVNGLQETAATIAKLQQQAAFFCDRHLGIGADGLIIVLPSEKADIRMKIINSDGSEAEMCGNGSRCFTRYVFENGLLLKRQMEIETLAGIIRTELVDGNDGNVIVRVDLGEPKLKRAQIPMQGDPNDTAVHVPIQIGEQTFYATAVSTGVPHCVIFVEDLKGIDLGVLGPKVECHNLFPRKTNVEFVKVVGKNEAIMKVWERGAGITMACGTGASATLVAAALNGLTERRAVIHLDGGDLSIEWDQNNRVILSGTATQVFQGKCEIR